MSRLPLRIGVCAPYDLAQPGGVNTHIRAQARALRARGHYVRVFGAASAALDDDGEEAICNTFSAVVHGTNTGFGVDPRSWTRVRRLFARERFDVLHIHEPLMPIVPWCATWLAPVPVVATFHVHREDGHRFYPIARPLLAPVMARVTRRIAVSNAARRTVARSFPGHYDIVPNGIDAMRFAGSADAEHTNGGTVLYVGRLEPRKGVEHLIDACAIAQTSIAPPRLVIIGDGPDRGALEARARDVRIHAVFAGAVTDEELITHYQRADVVCSPAIGGESFGIVLLEAMAAGRPVVATDIDGYVELVGGESNGARLVPPADPRALARELVAVLSDAPLRQRLGARGAAFAAKFDWSVIAPQLESIYYDVLQP